MNFDVPKFRRELLRWYDASRRDLPWRGVRDPYAILVSELMLQQTQVRTVLPYYDRFLKRFPTPQALAEAPEEAVLAAWAGLGYYRRARFLRAAARAVVEAGGFPRTLEGLRALPGVGAYTAAAVGSIAFGLPQAVVDGNVVRVLSRLLALEEDPTRGAGAARVREAAQALLDPSRPGDFNQAMMELGAVLCAPSKPACPACPLRSRCAAFLAGAAERYPRLPARPESRLLVKAVLLVLRGSGKRAEILARERGETDPAKAGVAKDRLKGFWAFPELELDAPDFSRAQAAASKEVRRLLKGGAQSLGRLPRVRHRITVYDIHLLPLRYGASASAEPTASAARQGWRWTPLSKLERLPLASAEKRLLASLKRVLSPEPEQGSQLGLRF